MSGAIALAVFATFWLVGGPLPHFDDVVFVGPAVRLASGESLANPYMRLWDPALASRYFVHSLFYPIALGGWLTLTGISAAAVTAFQCASLALAAWMFGIWLRRRGHGISWAPIPLMLVFFGTQGLRQDIFAMAFLGAALACSTARRSGVWALSGLFMGIAVATWPVLLGYGVSLIAATLLECGDRRLGMRRGLSFGVGLLLALGLFGAAIGWRWTEYAHDYGEHIRIVRQGASQLPGLWFELTNGWAEWIYGPMYLALVVSIVALLAAWRTVARHHRTLVVAILAALAANLILQIKPMHQVFDFFVGILLLTTAALIGTGRRRALSIAAALLFVGWSKSYDAMALMTQDHSRGQVDALRAQLGRHDKEIWFDEIAARYLFDYRLPPTSIYWNFSRPFPQVWPLDTLEQTSGSVWLIARGKADSCSGMERSDRVVLFGRELESLPRRPWELTLLE